MIVLICSFMKHKDRSAEWTLYYSWALSLYSSQAHHKMSLEVLRHISLKQAHKLTT